MRQRWFSKMPATKNSSGLSVDWILSRKNVPKLNKVVEWTLETRGNEEINAGRTRSFQGRHRRNFTNYRTERNIRYIHCVQSQKSMAPHRQAINQSYNQWYPHLQAERRVSEPSCEYFQGHRGNFLI